MKQSRAFLSTVLCLSFAITNSCSQTTKPPQFRVFGMFAATTPCNETAKKLLGISPDTNCEMMKWHLTLQEDANTSAPTGYLLNCFFGKAKQGTKNLTNDSTTVRYKGKWSTIKDHDNEIYQLQVNDPQLSISFLKLGNNMLHLLDENNQLMIGSAAWSYTLNRTDAFNSTDKSAFKIISTQNQTDTASALVFEGRAPCNIQLRALNNISAEGCQLVKCQLKLYRDANNASSGNFHLNTIYVGKGDTKYSNTGKWTIAKDAKADARSIIYQLETGPGQPQVSIMLLKGDDNILFFLDKDKNFLVGDNYTSYTLNRNKNKQ